MPTQSDLRISFHDHYQPRALAGVYTVESRHLLEQGGDPVPTAGHELPEPVRKFEIRAVRFVLDESSVHALYPAQGAEGDYRLTLPHITLDRAVLPWERETDGHALDVPAREPWLALLVFREGELPDDPEARGETVGRTVEELRHPSDEAVLGPELADEEVDDAVSASRTTTIDVPRAVFEAVVPRLDELRHLAHVRDVATAPTLLDDGEILTEGRYAVIAANRFARTTGAHAVHLVSLEGWKKCLGQDGVPEEYRAVRLCSLRSWSFRSDPEAALDARSLLDALAEPGRADAENLAPRLRPEGGGGGEAADYVARRLWLGYAPVPHRVSSGELTFGWYRGPCAPAAAPPVPVVGRETPHTTADHALVFEPENGLFDLSYAAAWTLGRALALSDPDYAAELARARRVLANRAVEELAVAGDPRLSALGERPAGLATEGLGRALVDALAAPQRPEADVPATPAVRARRTRPGVAALASAGAQTRLRRVAAERSGDMPRWLDGLALLRGVPFRHLVPHPDLLPPESLRFFVVDGQWVEALLAGARDVGVHTAVDVAADAALTAEVDTARAGRRARAGVLIRSALVRAWPVFELLATASGEPVAELRRDHLAPDVLLCLFGEVPDEVVIREPGQGIHFGVDHGGVVSLRGLTPGPKLGYSLGQRFPTEGSVFDDHLRPAEGVPDVLDVRGFAPALAGAFGRADLTPAQFALQLVNAPVEVRIRAAAPEESA
ncbi:MULTISPECIES: hypothetical protein [Actinosynnema]|uniref:hypothetical protein n=1 Tax=Actinosynnema TaxID=40566 RepID=UPI0020A2BE64|nr:hypothetical protein [Actinosynnema pretiosum]MCP2098795.1 hypothetical protein [Actinosynnema pretiosum]